MKTFVITPDGVVSDLRTAAKSYHIWSSPLYVDAEQILSQKNASPNLTLNVRGATASTWELWTWALLGAVLQLFSIALAGMATYHWKWTKAEAQVAEYGYPCFCAGTTCLIIAIVVCGHVIEGVTDEVTMSPRDEGTRILTYQEARTVGDQHFPSCAIFMTGDCRSMKFSRLNKKNYRSLVTISTSLAIVGYIIQFVGLRALHWSATIAQLGITLIMTAIRAWVRRGLASDPTNGGPRASQSRASHALQSGRHNQCIKALGAFQDGEATPARTYISLSTTLRKSFLGGISPLLFSTADIFRL
ncbi:hypothetical protein LCI18_010871 [Fusarium solani-melongenae]|uniref:Uncharacterized protein n=1 Tax=Fusarium solani subsp. cucurbitae TaxID=2747967 RepID=A0ACD3ZGF9_FUSSC|nr:hypothetical protein LCI18_010871 [Fusarium solani-melongenae]